MASEAAALAAEGQAFAESIMVDACIIRRWTGSTTDPGTFEVVPTYATVYEGKCRVRQSTGGGFNPGSDSDAMSGQQHLTISAVMLQIPATVTGVTVDQQCEVTTSLDPKLVGRTFRIDDPYGQTHATMGRFVLEEISPDAP